MKLVAEKLGKADKVDRLRFVRANGSETRCAMPRQGTLPHDLIHYVVESMLPLRHGFISLVSAGSDAGFAMQVLHDPANKAIETEAVQVEAIVEALQTQLWSNAFDGDAFLEAARLAAQARDKPVYGFSTVAPRDLYDGARALLKRWNEVPFHKSLELLFVPGVKVDSP